MEIEQVVILIIIVGAFIVIKNLFDRSKKKDVVNLKDLSSQEEKYETNKWIIENAINNNDIEQLERLSKNSNINQYADLSKLIDNFLHKNR